MTNEPPRVLLSVAETAVALAITERYVGQLVASGELASVKIGRRRLIARTELERFIESRTVRRSA